MDAFIFCSHCGEKNPPDSAFCTKCGKPLSNAALAVQNLATPHYSGKTALLLCLLLGFIGAHRFYVRKFGTGVVMLLTLGGFGLWVLVDLILISTNKFTAKDNSTLLVTQSPHIYVSLLSLLFWIALIMGSLFTIVMLSTRGLVDVWDKELQALRANDLQKAYAYTAKDFQSSTSLEHFTAFVNQYPSLKHNQSISIDSREINTNGMGMIKGVLTAEDGAKTPFSVLFIKEQDEWKILNISLEPVGVTIKHE